MQGNNAAYGEVGYLYANAGAFRDSGFTSVDQLAQPANCATTDTCDCLLSSNATNGTVPNNLSDVLINGRYGCYVGNKSSYAYGRFIPDHLVTAISTVGGVPMTCPAASGLACPASGFVYSGQAFTTQVTALNLTGSTTQNYFSYFAKAVVLTAWDSIGGAVNQNPGPGALSIPAPLVAGDFEAGVGVRKSIPPPPALPIPTPTPFVTYTFNTSPTVPTNIYLRAVDADNVSSRIAAAPGTSIEGGVQVVSGRIRVSDAYGSEQLPLPVTATVQYYNMAGSWLTSTTDSVTSFNPSNQLAVVHVKGSIPVNVTDIGPVTVANGIRSFRVNRPGVSGSADISLSSPSYLLGVPGRITFGVYKGANQFIYQREAY
jgi:MSHA biogenesis protein MshQ